MAAIATVAKVMLLLFPTAWPQASACNFMTGGASSFALLGQALVAKAPLKGAAPGSAAYDTSSSGLGIASLVGLGLCTAVSDDPMTLQQENVLADAFGGAKNRLTLPLVVASYGFFVNTGGQASTLQLNYLDTYNMFRFGGTWAKTSATGPGWTLSPQKGSRPKSTVQNGPAGRAITPISREGNSGTTLLFKTFWSVASRAANMDLTPSLVNAQKQFDGTQFPAPDWVTGQPKNLAADGSQLCKMVASTSRVGAIGYSQKSLCLPPLIVTKPGVSWALTEVQLLNAAGEFVASGAATNVSTLQALPTKLPLADGPWYAFSTVFSNGDKTPPVVSFIYALSLQNYPKAKMPNPQNAALVVPLLNYFNTQASALLATVSGSEKWGFIAIPPSVASQNAGAIATIKVV